MGGFPVTRIQADPVTGPIYERLLSVLAELGPFEMEEKKTSIHGVRGRAFFGIDPRKSALLINIVTTQPITSDRVARHDRVSANRVLNEVLLHSEAEVDRKLIAWIAQAYELTA